MIANASIAVLLLVSVAAPVAEVLLAEAATSFALPEDLPFVVLNTAPDCDRVPGMV